MQLDRFLLRNRLAPRRQLCPHGRAGFAASATVICGMTLAPTASADIGETSGIRFSIERTMPGSAGIDAAYGQTKDNRNGFLGTTYWNQQSVSGQVQIGNYSLQLSLLNASSKKDLETHLLTSGPDAGAIVFGGTTKTHSNSILGSVGRYFGSWYAGGFASYGQGDTRERRQGAGQIVTWDRDFDTFSFGATITGNFPLVGSWYAAPSAQYIQFGSSAETAVDTNGTIIAQEDNALTSIRMGGEIGYQTLLLDMIGSVGIRPFYVYNPVLFRDFSDKNGFDLTGFFTLAGEKVVTGLEVFTTFGREETDTLSGRIFVMLNF